MIPVSPGTWAAISQNTLSSVLWRNASGHTITVAKGGSTSDNNYMSAWNSAAFDTNRGRLVLAACGGDADGADNGVYSFDVETGLWAMEQAPTVDLIPPLGSTLPWPYVNAGGRAYPQSRHTYGGVCYAPAVQRVVIVGGVQWSPVTPQTDISKPWHWGPLAGFTGPFVSTGRWDEGRWTAWDSARTRLVIRDYVRMYRYDAATDTMTTVWDSGSSDSAQRFVTGIYDPVRDRAVAAGCTTSGTPVVDSYAFSPWAVTRPIPSAPWGTWKVSPGFAYDPIADRYVLWVGGASVWEIDPATWIVTQRSIGGVIPQGPAANGTWGRFAYAPTQDVFLVVSGVTQPVYAYRPVRGGPTYRSPMSFTVGVT